MAADVDVADPASPASSHVDLAVEGMTCASCAMRIEKRLNKLEGVTASVNYATERARIDYDAVSIDVDRLVSTVEATGYAASPIPPAGRPSEASEGATSAGGSIGSSAPGDGGAHDHAVPGIADRLLGSVILGVPVVLLSMVPSWQFRNWQWLALTLAAPVATWAAWPMHRAAALNLRHGAATMDTLISVGVTAAFGWSLWALFIGDAGDPGMKMSMSLRPEPGAASHHIYLEVAAGVVVFVLLGRFLEARAKRRAGDALRAIADLAVRDAAVLDDAGVERQVPIADLVVGDRFVVRPGERIATDGIVVEGASAVDNSLVTGESVPVDVATGDRVIGAAVNAGGRLVVRAERVGQDTALATIARLVEEAQTGKAAVQRLADRVASVFVPAVIVAAVATLGFWMGRGDGATAAFSAAVAVLIVACPCALGLATPTALLVGTGRAAQLGVLISGPEILESTRRIDTVVLDKTGTVTSGEMTVHRSESIPVDGLDSEMVLRFVGAVESAAEHPIGRAIAEALHRADGPMSGVVDVAATAGLGITARIEGHDVAVGRPSFVGVDPDSLAERADVLGSAWCEAEAAGRTAVVAAIDGILAAVVVVADEPRPTSAGAIAELRRIGLQPVLLTGDAEATARRVAAEVGIDRVHAGVLPSDKVDVVAGLQREGRVVAMVGDGVNDAAALATADLGIAMGSGSDVAIAASDLTLVRPDLGAVVDAIGLSRRTLTTIKGNLFWAFAYNVAAIPLAAAGLLNPLIAAAAMAASSVFVVTNSLRLRSFRRGADRSPG